MPTEDKNVITEKIKIQENGICIVFGLTEKHQIKLLHFGVRPFCEEELPWNNMQEEGFPIVQLDMAGFDRPYERHGNKYVVTAPGYRLVYDGMEDSRNKEGRLLVIGEKDEKSGVYVQSFWQFYDGTSVVRMRHKVINRGTQEQTLTYLSSFTYSGLEKEGHLPAEQKLRLFVPHNSWQKELNWRSYTLPELGFGQTQHRCMPRTSKPVSIGNTGNWSAKEYLPMGYLENTEADTGLVWQIEHNGSWYYEIADQNGHLLLNVSGPTEIQSHWFQTLKPGEEFESVPVGVGVSDACIDHAIDTLVSYRRRIRRKNKDNEELPVIFNDYMNCLFADPTTEKELPLIDAAAEAGCEYYVIDAGWYAEGIWWDSVGEWQECRKRFPNGVREVTDYIRKKGMVPGLWLELEVMGICCKKAAVLPDECFFVRHGKRVYDRSRYQLDFRHPLVIEHVNEVIDRVVREYGVGYIKMDYNIEPGIGTENHACSAGAGLLAHERAYLAWLDSVFERYPELVIENCSSGGLRMDYALLSRCSLQSTSDQEEYKNYAMIAANAPSGVNPEQAAVWSYPLRDGDREEVIFNMVNALLLRIHQSGHLAELSRERFELVAEGIAFYKSVRSDIARALPYWPLGLAQTDSEWMSLGLESGADGASAKRFYLAVWKKQGDLEDKELIPFPKGFQGRTDQVQIRQAYPAEAESHFAYDTQTGKMTVHFPKETMARVFVIECTK
ncbi:MAG: alpha-galactosidase [Clostridiales bacterium]|nr:alpha-galactosidase [Clostridiales bacterium]